MTSTAPDGWVDYVTHHPLGTAYQQAAAVGLGFQGFGLRTAFLTARGKCGELAGVLPLVEQS
jgi:hypothetical protein